MANKTPPGQQPVPTPTGAGTLTPDQISALAASGVGANLTSVSSGNKPTGGTSIYMGTTQAPLTGPGRDIQHGMTLENNMTYDEARMLPRDWMESDPGQLRKLVNTGILNKVPGFDVGMGLPEIMSAWDDLVTAAWGMNQNLKEGQKKWTPWDILNTYSSSKMNYGTVKKGDWLYDVATGERLKYVGPRSKTTTSRDVNLSSAEDVKALTTQILTQALGRAPTNSEVAQYKSTINAQEQANPTITTSTQTLDDQGQAVSQSSKTTGGFDAAAQQQLVQDQVSGTPEFAKYQSGTTYWNSLMQMLTGG